VRLRKYVTTEQVQQTLPVRREKARVEREPITDANLDAATSGLEISEEEHEVVLREEEPVVEKRVVPRERVRLDKDTVTAEERVAEEVRKEQMKSTTRTHKRRAAGASPTSLDDRSTGRARPVVGARTRCRDSRLGYSAE
jgi:uncharacterized protein (TIGR02271 family)